MRSGDDLAAHYASADVFLFPSLTETFGNVTTEAMASGLAVVAYQYAAAEALLRQGVNGMLAPYDDAQNSSQPPPRWRWIRPMPDKWANARVKLRYPFRGIAYMTVSNGCCTP
jgi:Glycosyltransferase